MEWVEDSANYISNPSQFAIAFEVLDKKNEALSCYRDIDANTEELELWTGLAKAHAAVGNNQDIIDIYLVALEKFPKAPSLYEMLGDTYTTIGGYDNAIEL
jgi:tetratricopeptide (TPR) repeat protein